MRWSWVWLLAGSLMACGQTRLEPSPDSVGGAAVVAGSSSGGSSSAAGTSSAGQAGSSSGGASGSGAVAGSAPLGGAAGTPNLFACSTPYRGPQGGPRSDGPEDVAYPCANIPDDLILERYDDFEARIPQGSYFESPTASVVWGEQCSNSPEETVSHRGRVAGALVATFTTPWFYEAEFCEGEYRRLFREFRCEYFDGKTFRSRVDEERTFFNSLSWWSAYGNSSDAVLLGYELSYGNYTDAVETCWLQTVHGDFGLCDEISLMSTTNTFGFAGEAKLYPPQLLRTIKGKCH